ncbi:MAG TPA: glycosyltransferase [Patescibacteria group bacterium]|nr:glycosyltransferase [Patescibacteria group bacterium]
MATHPSAVSERIGTGFGRPVAGPGSLPRPYRVAAIFHRPHPYFCKFFERLAARPEIDLTVYFYSDLGVSSTFDAGYQRSVRWDTDLLSGYKNHFLRNYAPQPNLSRYLGLFHPGLLSELRRGYDAVILHGWWGLSSSLVILSAFLQGTPLLIHSDKSAMEPGGAPHGRLRDVVLPRLFRHAAGFLAVGRSNADFYRKLGVPEEKMFFTPLAVDNAFFQAEQRHLAPQREAIRRKLGIPSGAVVFLYVGRLNLRKGLLDLLRAFAALSAESAHLMFVGDGPDRPALESYAMRHGIGRVHFTGLRNYSELPASYAASDVFVLPSHHEPWGAVINEAMNFAMPVVASRVVGAAADLVDDGVNGFLFEPGNVAQLTRRLQLLLGRPDLRKRMGRESARRIAGWDYDCGVEGVLAALGSVVRLRDPHET